MTNTQKQEECMHEWRIASPYCGKYCTVCGVNMSRPIVQEAEMTNTQKQEWEAEHGQFCPIFLARFGRWYSLVPPKCSCAMSNPQKTYTQSEVDALLAKKEAEMVERIRGLKKTGNDGEGVPFENSPEIIVCMRE